MMRFLEYDFLAEHNLQTFDQFVTVFGEQKTDWELAPAGNTFKERTRIANYTGMPELMSMFKMVADIRTADTLQLDVPECETHVVNVEATPFQKTLVQELADRADDVQNGNVQPTIDNMLRITSDGRKLGLDPRLIDPSFEDDPETKLNKCVENVLRIHKETEPDRLTQIIFCDLGVPHGTTSSDARTDDEKSVSEQNSLEEENDFCIYDDIRKKLIAGGIPAEEIAYIHDAKTEAQKTALFDKVRSGSIRVLLGSTPKMGTGTNVQDKLIAIHDLDIPWRPADMEQRKGRIVRQGNQNSKVHVYRYVTKGTFDAYSYQTLESKQRFISQIMTSKSPVRKCEDVDQQALSYGEIKALCTGDDRIREKMILDKEVRELRMMKAEHANVRYELRDKIARSDAKEARLMQKIAEHEKDKAHIDSLPKDKETGQPAFRITIGETVYTDRKDAAKAFEDMVFGKTRGFVDKAVTIGSFHGFPLSVTLDSFTKSFRATLTGASSYCVELGASYANNLKRMENAIFNIEGRISDLNSQLNRHRVDIAEAKRIVAIPFANEQELQEKSERLDLLTDQLTSEAIAAKKNAPEKQRTCYFERAKLKKEAAKVRNAEKKVPDKDKETKKANQAL